MILTFKIATIILKRLEASRKFASSERIPRKFTGRFGHARMLLVFSIPKTFYECSTSDI